MNPKDRFDSGNTSRPGKKRGRDRTPIAGGFRERSKFRRGGSGAAKGQGRKKREEFIDQIVTRPVNFDKRGLPQQEKDAIVNVVANYFPFSGPKQPVTGYRVDFRPQVEVPAIRKRLIYQNKPTLGVYVYDGANEVFLSKPLAEKKTELEGTNREGENYKLSFLETGTVRYTDARFLQVRNLMVRDAMRCLNLQLIGKNFYDADKKVIINIPQYRLQIWPGYDTSIRQHEHELLLNCDLRHKVMRQENVLSVIKECLRANGGKYREAAARKIIGATVFTDYNNATYKITDIDWDRTPADTFETKTGSVSFADYYQNRYQLEIRDLKQPLLVSKASARNIRAGQPEFVLLVPELCRMTGLTDADRNNFQLMRAMADRTRMTPTDRVRKLLTFSERINLAPGFRRVFEENELQVERNLLSFEARRFQYEELQLEEDAENPRSFVTLNEKVDWTGSTQKSMFRVVLDKELKNWYFVYPTNFKTMAEDFLTNFMEAANGFLTGGRRVVPAIVVPLSDYRTFTYEKDIKQILRQDPSFLMVVIPNKRDDVYSALKRLTIGQSDTRPVAIQVITEHTCRNDRKLFSIALKIAVNCKLGGIPWLVNLRRDGLMIVGFDISVGKGRKSDTYGAMVASLNPQNNGGHYFSMAKKHADGSMLANNFGVMIRAAIGRYVQCNDGALPKAILIYRDGVGDGDLDFVNHQELGNIKRDLASIYGGEKEVKLAFIIVNKKTNTRIMQKAREGAREPYSNPLPGTVIDDFITLPERIDFYLISQAVNQGTVSPIYYNVLENSIFPSTRGLQHLSYKLCHNYFNWTGTVRIPSVVQYAKKLAKLAQDTLNGAPSELIDLNRQLYFL